MREWIALSVATITIACGSSKKPTGDTAAAPVPTVAPQNSFMVADNASLPSCELSRKGALAYVTAEKKFYGCDGANWAVVEIKGEAGAKGEVGAAGADNQVKKQIFCQGTTSPQTLNGHTVQNLYVVYDATVFNSGDVFVSASIGDNTLSVGRSNFYSSKQTGAVTGGIVLTDDFIAPNDAGYWNISLDRSSNVITVKYSDASFGQAPNSLTWTFSPSACTVQNF